MKVPYPELPQADLCVGAVYLQEEGQLRGEPIQALGFSNMGGFRPRGGWTVPAARAVALFSTGDQQEWPDHRDLADGTFTYYGDNRDPGRSVEDALEKKAKGNRLLRSTFDALHAGDRRSVPPFFVFEQDRPGDRSVRFLGLAAPGADHLGEEADLVATWTTVPDGRRFVNYRAVFTLLDVDVVSRTWLDRVTTGGDRLDGCPDPWRRFLETGRRRSP